MNAELSRSELIFLSGDLIDACVDHKSWLYLYCWLWRFAETDAGQIPESRELAKLCGTSTRDINKGMDWLLEQGWIEDITPLGQPQRFHIHLERISEALQ